MGLLESEVSGEDGLLPSPGVGLVEETTGSAVEGERNALGVGDAGREDPAEEDRRSGRFWLDERRLLRPSCSPVAIFLLSLRMGWDESSTSPSSCLRAVCNTHKNTF